MNRRTTRAKRKQAERLNERTSKRGCESLSSAEMSRGVAEERSRRTYTVIKQQNRTAATVPLTDGQTPPGDQLSVTDFQAQIQWYGSFVTINRGGDSNKSALIDLELLAA